MTELRAGFVRKQNAQILYLPTGGGKTETAFSMMIAAANKGKRVAMVMDLRTLVEQTSARLDKYSIEHGVLMAGHWRYQPERLIQVCSIQTLEARESFPAIHLLIVDEAHCSRKSIKDFIAAHPEIKVIGLTATPFTKGLGNTYSRVVSTTTAKELTEQGWLAPLEVFVAKQIDMTGAKTVAGEWSDKDASERGIQITGDVVETWIKITHDLFGGPEKSMCFSAGVAHGDDLSRQWAEHGYNFINLSYKDDDGYKKEVLAAFNVPRQTEIHGIIAVDLLSKGYDCPDVMIGISARPFTKSLAAHIQQMGRVKRPFPGKDKAVWICHSGNYLRFRDDWDRIYAEGVHTLDNLEAKPRAEPTDEQKAKSKCPKCGALWPPASDVCKHCGHTRVRRNDVVTKPGEVVSLDKKADLDPFPPAVKQSWYSQLLGYARTHKKPDGTQYSDGWAYHKYIQKFGSPPPAHFDQTSCAVGLEVKNFITYLNIRHHKIKGKR